MKLAKNQTSIDADVAGTQGDGSRTAAPYYFPRRLRVIDDQEQAREVDEAGLLAVVGPRIVLGEPGMGKSELIREIGRRLEVQPITAIRFMLSRNPAKFVVANKPLLIDGLDEAMARREGDAVDMILAQLEEAGSPDFILSCRAREWQARNVTNLGQLYSADPTILTLEALSRREASAFLVQRYANANSDHVLNHLDEHTISDLYRNPLTLGLMGQVAEIDVQLPATRAELFERVCGLIWPEHDPSRRNTDLGAINKGQALSAAGAIMAGLMLAGADAASLSGPAQLQDGDVRLADLETLPGAGAARAIFSSKLFHSVGVDRAKPIHRVIAEFLGARWLAQQTTTRRTQRRLLRQLHGSGGVPASLRGLHAWLAFHGAAMAKAVIAADPFGVLRYGETASLTSDQAQHMFDALQALAEVDPHFRAQDWDGHTAAGLMIPNLQAKIQSNIASADSNWHLRSLLIEGLKDSALAGNLANTLETVMLSTERFYHERNAAADALMPHRDRVWWRQAIVDLGNQGTEDSTRLARNLIEDINCDVTDELLVATLFAEMGVTISPLPRTQRRPGHTLRRYRRIVQVLRADRLTSVLNLLAEYSTLLNDSDWQNLNDLADIVSPLIVRSIDEGLVLPKDAAVLWNWLGTLTHVDRSHHMEEMLVQERLEEHADLRRAVQQHALYVVRPRSTIWMSEIDLRQRGVGLEGRTADVVWFLERLGEFDNKDTALREDWCDLMRLGIGHGGFNSEVRVAGRRFQRSDAQLEAFARKLENPKKSACEFRRERKAAKQEKKKRVVNEIRHRYYTERKAALRAGEFGTILEPAQCYLGFANRPRSQSPTHRIVEWLGAELAADAFVGFEAVLHRTDIPTAGAVASGFIEGIIGGHCFAIMAGLLARNRANRDFTDLSANVRATGLVLCYEPHGIINDGDLPALQAALEQIVLPTAQDRKNFARMWIEPSLVAGTSYIPGLNKLAHDERWLETGAELAAGWLMTFPNVPESVELALVDCLTHANALGSLIAVSLARANQIFHTEEQLFAWLAIDVLVRFETVQPNLSDIGVQNPEFIWYLRDRLQPRRHGAMLPLSVAQAKWIMSEFRAHWPFTNLQGHRPGPEDPYEASQFLRGMIIRLANDTSTAAGDAMQELVHAPVDTYSALIRHMAAEQRQKRVEEDFAPLLPNQLGALLAEGPPSNVEDLKSLVLEELEVAQKILIGDDLDQVRDFWSDAGVPYDENRCRDRLAAMIGPELLRCDVQRITEADMPNTKRADLAFARGQLQLPMEVKGQWHPDVWQAATDQLDAQYLIDWRSEQRGIYCVLWFGELPSASGRRLKLPPKGMKAPTSADEMRQMLSERIPESRRFMIDVVVLDVSAGRP